MSSTALAAFRPLILEQARQEVIEDLLAADPKKLGCSPAEAINAVPAAAHAIDVARAARLATREHHIRQAPKVGLDAVAGTRIPAGQTLRITPDDLSMGETRRFDLSDGTFIVVTRTLPGLEYQQMMPMKETTTLPYPLSRPKGYASPTRLA